MTARETRYHDIAYVQAVTGFDLAEECVPDGFNQGECDAENFAFTIE